MLPSNHENITLKVQKTEQFLLYRVVGPRVRPLRFDLINLDGKKVRSIDLLFGKEFVIPIRGLATGEYLFALSSAAELLQTGVITI